MKYLFWRNDNLWCRFPIPGKPKGYRYSLGIKCSPELSKAQAELLAMQNGYKPMISEPDPSLFESMEKTWNPTLTDVLNRYYDRYLRYKTYKECVFTQVKTDLGKKAWNDVTIQLLTEWVAQKRTQGFEIATLRLYLTLVKGAYGYLAYEELDNYYKLSDNPLERLRITKALGKQQANIRNHYVCEDDIERAIRFFDRAFPPFVPFYTALYLTGRRPMETAEWRWEWVTEEIVDGQIGHRITLPPSICKNRKISSLWIPDRLWTLMTQQGWRNGLIFRNPDSRHKEKRWTCCAWSYRIQKLKDEYPNDPVFADLWCRDTRRAYITREGRIRPIDRVQLSVGHADLKSTLRYRVYDQTETFHDTYVDRKEAQNDTKKHTDLKTG